MLQVIDRHKINEDFGVLEGSCADCGELVLLAKDVFGDTQWLHKVVKGNGYFGFEYFCPEKKEKK